MLSLDWVLPDGVSGIAGVTLILCSALTSFVTAAIGAGGGLMMFAIMAALLPATALIPVHGIVQLGSSVSRSTSHFHDIRLDVLCLFGLGSALGVALGATLVPYLPSVVMQYGLAAFILWSAWERPRLRLAGVALPLGGALSSFLTMFLGATGPFTAALVKTLQVDRLTYVATQAACMALQHGLKIIAFGLIGFVYTHYVPLVALMIATGALGTYLGKTFLIRTEEERFQALLRWVMTLLALRLVWMATAMLAA